MLFYKNFDWVYSSRLEKADRWRHKDGTWWTNVDGNVVPWRPDVHGTDHRKVGNVVSTSDFDDEHKKLMHYADTYTAAENATRRGLARSMHDYDRDRIRAVHSAIKQGLDVPAEYVDRVAQYLGEHAQLGEKEGVRKLVDKLRSAERWTTAGDDPTSAEREEAGVKAERDDRRKALGRRKSSGSSKKKYKFRTRPYEVQDDRYDSCLSTSTHFII